MSTVFVDMKGATLTFAATELELASAGTDVSCQIQDAHVSQPPETETVAATLCTDPVDRVVGFKPTLEITAFQDWTDPAGLCWFLVTNKGDTQWFELALLDAGSYKGTVQLAPLDYGGTAGTSLTAPVSLPVSELTETAPVA